MCGHIHSYFQDTVDGITLIASGGGGARIEEVPGVENCKNHWLEFFLDSNDSLQYERKEVSLKDLDRSISVEVKNALGEAFSNECNAHLLYRLYAEEAMKQGKTGVAKLFYAAADAEFYHARNHYFAMGGVMDLHSSIIRSIERED